MSRTPPAIVWFRQDLRTEDQPALYAAASTGAPVLALYVLDDSLPWPLGGAARWWLHGSLASLAASLEKLGTGLVLRRRLEMLSDPPASEIERVVDASITMFLRTYGVGSNS